MGPRSTTHSHLSTILESQQRAHLEFSIPTMHPKIALESVGSLVGQLIELETIQTTVHSVRHVWAVSDEEYRTDGEFSMALNGVKTGCITDIDTTSGDKV